MVRPRVAIVAGEPSGDQLGAHLVDAIRRRVPDVEFFGIAGPRMQAAGVDVLFPMERLAVRGLVEVLRHLPEIAGIRRRFRARVLEDRPSVFIGIDAPDFNLGLEEGLRKRGIPTIHYVSPTIWAWRPGRIHLIRRAVSRMLALFPFEAPLYEQAGVPVTYVGHPLAETLPDRPDRLAMRAQMRLPSAVPVVALLPGSRASEIEYMAEPLIRAARIIARENPDVRFLVPVVSRETHSLFEAALYRLEAADLPLSILYGHAHDAMIAADVVLVTSGTATLEAALLGRAMVIAYRVSPLTAWIVRRKARAPFVGLPNILAGRAVVPEFLQEDVTPENLAQAVLNLLGDDVVRKRVEQFFLEMRQALRQDTAERAAGAVLPYLQGGAPA